MCRYYRACTRTAKTIFKKSLNRVHAQIEKLISIIGDLLDVSKIRTGSLTFHKQNFDINLLVKEIIEELGLIFPTHKILF